MQNLSQAELDSTLATLQCEIDTRPLGAPTLDDVLPVLGAARLESGALVLEFHPDHLAMVEAFAAAERQCCSGIGWDVDETPALRISAKPEQLELLAVMLTDGSRS